MTDIKQLRIESGNDGKFWPTEEKQWPWPEDTPEEPCEKRRGKFWPPPYVSSGRQPGRPELCAWEKIGTGVFLGQPYLAREGSPHQNHWVVRLDQIRSQRKRRYLVVSLVEAEARAEAERWAGRWIGTPSVDLVLEVWARDWLPQLKAGTRKRALGLVRIELAWWAKTPVTEITQPMLWRYIEHWVGMGKSPNSIKQSLAWLRRALSLLWAGELEGFQWEPPDGRDPASRITAATKNLMNQYGHLVKQRDAFTEAEIRTIFEVTREKRPDWYPFIRLAFGTGMRCGELRALKWDAVDWEAKVLVVRANFSMDTPSTPKRGAQGLRVVHIPEGCVELLLELRAQTLLDLSALTDEWVFQKDRSFLTETHVQYVLGEIFDECHRRGVRAGMTLHCCRHTFVSQAQSEGLAERWIQQNAGMTAQTVARYTHLRERPDLAWADYGEERLQSEGASEIVASVAQISDVKDSPDGS